MTKPYLRILLLSLSFTSSPVFAAANPQFPNDLLYAGKPIDSLCFSNPDRKIDLRHCGAAQEKYAVKSINNDLSKKGYTGYDWEDASIPSGSQGYTYYKFFNAGNNQYWIYSINNGGGSGDFTNLYLVQRLDSHTLGIQTIAGGDRCNGGIQNVTKKNNHLTFSVNLTPYDLIALSNTKIQNLNAYDDLAACAVCCAAKAFYIVDNQSKLKFDYADLGKTIDASEMPDQGKYQACFNKLFVSHTSKNDTVLNQKKIDAFSAEFKNACISAQGVEKP